MEKALRVGSTAPDFSLTNAPGEQQTLHQSLRHGPVVPVWYPGGWGPYCNIALRAYQGILSEPQDILTALSELRLGATVLKPTYSRLPGRMFSGLMTSERCFPATWV